jgi:hypothetical protein
MTITQNSFQPSILELYISCDESIQSRVEEKSQYVNVSMHRWHEHTPLSRPSLLFYRCKDSSDGVMIAWTKKGTYHRSKPMVRAGPKAHPSSTLADETPSMNSYIVTEEMLFANEEAS